LPADSILRFERVTFAYAGRPPVLRDVSFAVAPGDVLALVGRSGAGKSTILKLINRLLLPHAGRVIVENRDTREWQGIPLRRRIGYVLQDIGLFPHMTVEENVGLVPRLEKWDAGRTHDRVQTLLDLVGLPPAEYAARQPHQLSGGQRQRVGVARALAADPPMLLMDEPFGALDPITRVEIRREFARIQRDIGTTVVLVTHDLGEAFAMATRIGVLDGGDLAICDTPDAVAASTDPRVRRFLETVWTGQPAGPQAPAGRERS
jgi:osmoprotectant transport system ATP-binding protein